MRSLDTLVHRCVHGTPLEREALVGFLPFGHAKPFFATMVTEEDWERDRLIATDEFLIALLREYTAYTGKEIQRRYGGSAFRSDVKLRAWVWLLGHDDLLEMLQVTPYGAYGEARVALICATLGFPYPTEAVSCYAPA